MTLAMPRSESHYEAFDGQLALDLELRSDEFLALLVAAHGRDGRPDYYKGYNPGRATRPAKFVPPLR
jgi:hypothetical protein